MVEKELGERNYGFDSEQQEEEKGIVSVCGLPEGLLSILAENEGGIWLATGRNRQAEGCASPWMSRSLPLDPNFH